VETRRSRIADIAQGASPVPDKTTDDLAPGFYWVRVDGLPPEVARRDAEAGEWVLTGSESGIADGHPAEVVVVSGPLVPIDKPALARRLAAYLTERARAEGESMRLTRAEFEDALDQGIGSAFGVHWDVEGNLIRDDQEPEPGFLAWWRELPPPPRP
jgi:hypothetical protein